MGIFGYFWVFLGIFGYFWVFLDIFGIVLYRYCIDIVSISYRHCIDIVSIHIARPYVRHFQTHATVALLGLFFFNVWFCLNLTSECGKERDLTGEMARNKTRILFLMTLALFKQLFAVRCAPAGARQVFVCLGTNQLYFFSVPC